MVVSEEPKSEGAPSTWTFSVGLSVVLLALVVLGFARTFFLRPWFDTYDVQAAVLWHGAAMTLWFVWLPLQAGLVARRDVALHRRLGWLGAAAGALAVLSALAVNFAMVVRGRRSGRDIEAEIDRWSDVIWTNLAPALVFALCFSAAIALRRRRDAHGRLLLIGSIALVDPALARVGLLPDRPVFGVDLDTLVFTRMVPLLLVLALLVRDLRSRGRVHGATGLGVALLWAGLPLLRSWVPTTRFGHWLVLVFA